MKYLIFITILIIASQVDAKQKFYKWTDENGNIHYTNKKPKNKQIDEIKVYNSQPTLVTKESKSETVVNPEQELTDEQKSVMAFNKAEQQRVQAIQDRENCKIAQKNKATLEKSFNIKRKNPATGEYIKMNKTEIMNKIKEVNKSIKRLCK
ncbi:MAG: DUF4124 domain-containing protein [Marinicellaceae bacterium]